MINVAESENFKKCTGLEQKFILAYCNNGFNAYQAGIEAGYKQPREATYKALQRPRVKGAISEYVSSVVDDYKEVLEANIVKTLVHRAFYRPSDIVDEEGYLVKPLSKLGELQVCIDSIRGNKPILANREKALELLCKYMNLIQNNTTVNNTQINNNSGVLVVPAKMTRDQWIENGNK